jgi:phage tail sheath protein FI
MAYGRPGVYVTERLLPAPITGIGTANAAGAAIGRFGQGPETVTLITSWYGFVKTFGGYDYSYPATFGIGQFFKNGGTELYVRRVLATDAVAATTTIPKATSGTLGTVTAKNRGADGNNLRIKFAAATTAGYYNLSVFKEAGTSSASELDDILLETFLNVKITNTVPSSDYVVDVVNNDSAYITIAVTDGASAPSTSLLVLTAGTDSTAGTKPTAAEYLTALSGFEQIARPLVLFSPEILADAGSGVGVAVQANLVSWASTNDGFVVLDTLPNLSVTNAVAASTAVGVSSSAAMYYPNIYIADPLGRNATSLRKVGPAASVAGVYLATDAATGPYKAPAGIRLGLGGVLSVEKDLTNTELDILNSSAFPVNAIRPIAGSGVVIMGARTLKQDGTPNRYVNTRRSLIYLKRHLKDITQFALFEGNDDILWARLRTVIGTSLNDYRNKGGLAGGTEAEAFFIKIDEENNTATSIANGEVNIEIGVALQFPAEFIVITLSQKTSN